VISTELNDDTLQDLVAACQANENLLRQQAQARTESWQPWLDLQWYTFQSLARSGQEVLSGIITADLKGCCAALPDLKPWPLITGRRLPMRSR
jgi:type VI secretion system protein VasJ